MQVNGQARRFWKLEKRAATDRDMMRFYFNMERRPPDRSGVPPGPESA